MYAVIKRTKNRQLRIVYTGENGEPLATSEPLTSNANVNKNLVAMMKLTGGQLVDCKDLSGKAEVNFIIDDNGKRHIK